MNKTICSIQYTYNEVLYNKNFDLNKPEYTFEGVYIKVEKKEQEQQNRLTIAIFPETYVTLHHAYLTMPHQYNTSDRIFCNGFQSWTESREYTIHEKIKPFPTILKPILNRYKINNYGDSHFYKYTGKKGILHGFTYTYIKNPNKKCYLIGSLNDDKCYTIFTHNTRKQHLLIEKDCEDYLMKRSITLFNLIFIEEKEQNIMDHYFQALDIRKSRHNPYTGWTSWYNYYGNITEKITMDNLNAFAEHNIPIDIFQVDDGYHLAVGDWLTEGDNFKCGMTYIADQIKSKGYKAGIWIAPFICQKKSFIYENHQDWLIKDKKGNPLILGYNRGYWDDQFYVLDFYNNAVRNYLQKVFHVMFSQWRFDMIKIDFLYALSVIKRHDKTRAMILTEAINFLRNLSGDKLILGCGVPLANAFGVFDFCRVGSDISPHWENNLYKFVNYRERVSTINSMKSSIFRHHLNRHAFLNDPDVFILRDENTTLSYEKRYTLFLINQIFGSLLFTSDNINTYSRNIMDLYKSQFPVRHKDNIQVLNNKSLHIASFSIKESQFLAVINLGSKPITYTVDSNTYYCGKTDNFIKANKKIELKPYSSKCLLKIQNSDFELIGSTGHIFPTTEVEKFIIKDNNIVIKKHKKHIKTGKIYIKIPDNLDGYLINDTFYKVTKKSDINLITFE